MVSSVSDSIVVVDVTNGGIYVGLGDVVDSYVGRLVVVINVDSMSVSSTSIMIVSVPKSEEMTFKNIM